eukprot:9694127-Lingulodinium_polyedra.AAC.1
MEQAWGPIVQRVSAQSSHRRFACTHGPASALVALLLRYGWAPTGPCDWLSPGGDSLLLPKGQG